MKNIFLISFVIIAIIAFGCRRNSFSSLTVTRIIEIQQQEHIFFVHTNFSGQSVILIYPKSTAVYPGVEYYSEPNTGDVYYGGLNAVRIKIGEKKQIASFNSIYYFNNQSIIQKHINYSDIGYKNVSTMDDVDSVYDYVSIHQYLFQCCPCPRVLKRLEDD